MKKYISFIQVFLIIIILFASAHAFAQVGIGTNSPSVGTMLDIDSDGGSKGVLFPKVDIADLATATPLPLGTEEGTLVYNTNVTTGKGYFYWSGSFWIPMDAFVGTMAKFSNSDFSVGSRNLNVNNTTAPIVSNVEFNDNNVLYQSSSTVTDRITITEAGKYKVVINLSLEAYSSNNNSSLLAIEAQMKVNNQLTGGIYRSSEMVSANSTTPDYGSITFTEVVTVNANQTVSIKINKTQANGAIYLRNANASSIFIERLD